MTDSSQGWELFVVTTPGLEGVTAGELRALGFGSEALAVERGGITLHGGPTDAARLNACLRTASRVLLRVARFRAVGFQDLLKRGKKVPWGSVLPSGLDPDAVRFEVTCRKSRLYHTGAIEERLRSCLPSGSQAPDPSTPTPRFVVRVFRDEVTISADTAGEGLHKRGYRGPAGKAPLRETLGAALVMAARDAAVPAGEPASLNLVDPFCGSGTVVIEAASLAARVWPGANRTLSMEGWAGSPSEEIADTLNVVRSDSAARLQSFLEGPDAAVFQGSDRDAGAVAAATANAEAAGFGQRLRFLQAPLSSTPLPDPGLMVANPPYGHRVGDPRSLRNLYARWGERLRADWSGGCVAFLSADASLSGQLRLDTRELFTTQNGGITVRALFAEVP